MSFKKYSISFSDTHSFSPLVIDYLSGHEDLRKFITAFPTVEALQHQIRSRKEYQEKDTKKNDERILLKRVLQQQYNDISLSAGVQKNMEALLSEDTFTVCAAHQPCIFTGPLYFIYKITHAIKLANECSQLFPAYNFVPVFYMGSEDNDIDEIGTLYLGNEKLKWQTAQTGACGRMSTRDLEPITHQVLAILNENEPDEKWLSSVIQHAYLKGSTLSDATRILVNALFEHTGLLILDADDPELKRQFAPVILDELFNQHSAKQVHDTAADIAQHYKVQAAGRDINLFYLNGNIRERIEKKKERWVVHNTGISFSADELRKEVNSHPERFSPNVILRPLYQEMLLPDIAFLGGGGELAYWLELKGIFQHYEIPYPLIFLRNSFLLIGQRLQAIIAQLNLSDADIFLSSDKLYKKLLADDDQLKALEDQLAELENIYQQIEKTGADISINLSGSMQAHRAKAKRISDRIRQKYLSHIKRSESDKMQHADKLKQSLFPSNTLQERHDNFIPYFKKYGRKWIDELIANQKGVGSEFVVLRDI